MSYILDALRKAEAQRERSRAPGLHDRPLGTGGDSPAPAGSMSWVAGSALALGVVAVGVLAWVLVGRTSAPAQPPVVPAASLPAAAPPAVATVAAAPPQPAASAMPPVAAAVLPPPMPTPLPALAPAGVQPAAATATAPASAAAPAAPAPRQAEPATVPPPGAPRVSISGGVWSSEPSQRLLVSNGQVVNEGGELAPGLVLEQVRQGNRAVLVWQGQRFLVGW